MTVAPGKTSTRIVDYDKHVPTRQTFINSCNNLIVEAGTNGYHGGDAGHGSCTYIRIEDAGGTSWDIKLLKHLYDEAGVEIILRGDAELKTIAAAMRFITETLEERIRETEGEADGI